MKADHFDSHSDWEILLPPHPSALEGEGFCAHAEGEIRATEETEETVQAGGCEAYHQEETGSMMMSTNGEIDFQNMHGEGRAPCAGICLRYQSSTLGVLLGYRDLHIHIFTVMAIVQHICC